MGAASVAAPSVASRPPGVRRSGGAAAASARDVFPHTRRPLPWLLAGFMALIFFVPIAATELKVHLPVDSRIDRFGIVILVLAWLWFGGDQRAFLRTRRSKLFVVATAIFLALAVASLLLDAQRIVNLGDFKLAEKRFALLGSFLVLSWFALTALRYEDIRGFATYLIGLASLMSIGMLIERHTGYNVFYEWSRAILSPIAKVGPSPTNIHPMFGSEGRVWVVGPTQHGLAASAMLVMVMPFALVRVFDATASRERWLSAGAFALMVAGSMATDRKTALVAAAAVLVYITLYRPRQVLRFAPVGVVVIALVVHVAAPGALGTVFSFKAAATSRSTTHRIGDFTDIIPDVVAHPVIGRGFGSLNPEQPSQFRINDDEYIDELWEVGFVGLAAFAWMILAPIVLARRAIRSRRREVSSLALAASGGCVAFLVVCALFDALSFPEAPYMFFLVAALTTIAAAGPEGNVVPLRQLVKLGAAGGRPRAAAAT